ncbi:MAG: SPOR domain-containing protein [Rhodocyclaceae bacterium]|nr:SPOR domain-containing protein [Rhodocyclaceae bacterium]MBK9623635.1 SPOR domain-containing protein [Rhodocyclaceae bacterium]MBP6108984.1 SPOR domain-containing protein [Rhodocyclaceae bacterium]MBP6279938.1 SPOR domain-containing protein [Rhodocyclaceae bacterium]
MNNPAYSKQPSSTPAKGGGGMILGIFIGLVLGILIAAGVVLFLNKATLPFQDKYEGANKPSAANSNGQAATPLALPGKPGGTVQEKQRLDFYGILEGKTSPTNPPVAKTNTPPTATATTTPPTATEPTVVAELLYLQLGAFQKAADAENLKAKLALTGFDAAVQEVEIPNKGTMQRVRVGPFATAAEMNAARERLSQAGIAGTVIKQKP